MDPETRVSAKERFGTAVGAFNLFGTFTVTKKLLLIVSLNIGLLLVVAGVSIYQMNKIGGELFSIAEQDMPLRDRLRAYAAVAHANFETERFHEFCERHLAHLDELAWEFFGSDMARNAVHEKVRSLYPAHEVEPFTEMFWHRIQLWRERENDPSSFGS